MNPEFTITHLATDGDRRVWRLGPGEWIIGSDPECAVVLTGAKVSARHVRLVLAPDFLQAEDLESASGTVIDGQWMDETVQAKYPVSLRVGEAVLAVKRERSSTGRRFHQKGSETPDAAGADDGLFTEGLKEERAELHSTYTLKREIWRGGMSRIYEAVDSQLNRSVAVKVCYVSGHGAGRPEDSSGFWKEAEILARLSHPNIVPVYNCGKDSEGRPIYGMKLVKGSTLQEILEGLSEGDPLLEKLYPRDQLLTVFSKICDAVAFAHSNGVLHRDLKPENVMVGEFGEVLVMDWGLARSLEQSVDPGAVPREEVSAEASGGASETPPPRGTRNRWNPGATMEGDIVGSPKYMSPEQAAGRAAQVDERSDVYALGGILYAMLTYRSPVEGRSVDEVLSRVRRGRLNPINEGLGRSGKPKGSVSGAKKRGPWVPPALESVVSRAMALLKEDRYQTVPQFQAEIHAYQAGFAPEAFHASLGSQLWMLVQRHRRESVLLCILLCLMVGFVAELALSRRQLEKNVAELETQTARAQRNEEEAVANAKRAQEKEEEAQANEQKAREKEEEALRQKESLRIAAAKSNLLLAEEAALRLDGNMMEVAMARVPSDLRSKIQEWRYMDNTLNSAEYTFENEAGSRVLAVIADPSQRSSFVTVEEFKQLVKVRRLNLGKRQRVDLFHWEIQAPLDDFVAALSADGSLGAMFWRERGTDARVWKLEVRRLSGGELLFQKDLDKKAEKVEFSPDGSLLLVQSSKQEGGESVRVQVFVSKTGETHWVRQCGKDSAAMFCGKDGLLSLLDTNGFFQMFELEQIDLARRESISKTSVDYSYMPQFRMGRHIYAPSISGDSLFVYRLGALLRLPLFTAESAVAWRLDSGDAAWVAAVGASRELVVSVSRISDRMGLLQFWNSEKGTPDDGKNLRSFFFGTSRDWAHWRVAVHPLSMEAAVSDGTRVRVWRCEDPVAAYEIKGRSGDVYNANLFVGPLSHPMRLRHNQGTGDNVLEVYAPPSAKPLGEPIRQISFPKFPESLTASSDGGVVAVRFASEIEVSRWDGFAFSTLGRWIPPKSATRDMLLDPSGERLWVGSSVHEAVSGNKLATFRRQEVETTGSVSRGAVWLNRNQIAEIVLKKRDLGDSATVERRARALVLWDVQTGEPVASVYAPEANSLSLAPGGRHLLEAGRDRRVRIRSADTLEILPEGEMRVHDGPVTCAVYHPTLPYVITSSEDLSVKIWNYKTGALLERFAVFRRVPLDLMVSADGRTLGVVLRHTSRIQIFYPKSFEGEVR